MNQLASTGQVMIAGAGVAGETGHTGEAKHHQSNIPHAVHAERYGFLRVKQHKKHGTKNDRRGNRQLTRVRCSTTETASRAYRRQQERRETVFRPKTGCKDTFKEDRFFPRTSTLPGFDALCGQQLTGRAGASLVLGCP